MRVTEIQHLMSRDFEVFIEEIVMFPEDKLYIKLEGIANPGGTLGLHMAGNIQHYIGAGLGNSGYVRDRDLEFSARNISKDDILSELHRAADVLDKTLSNLTDDRLQDPYPDLKPWAGLSIGFVLGQLLGHLNYHRGQVNYLRRILTGA